MSRFTRLLNGAALGGLLLLIGALALTPGPAYAHDGISLTVQGDGAGAVWSVVTLGDGHPADGPISAVMFATSDTGGRVGPVALRAVPGTNGVMAYQQSLPPGRWRVSIDVAMPGPGHCEAELVVGGAPPTPTQQTCAPSPTPAASAPASDARGGVWIVLVLAGAAVIAALGLALVRRHR